MAPIRGCESCNGARKKRINRSPDTPSRFSNCKDNSGRGTSTLGSCRSMCRRIPRRTSAWSCRRSWRDTRISCRIPRCIARIFHSNPRRIFQRRNPPATSRRFATRRWQAREWACTGRLTSCSFPISMPVAQPSRAPPPRFFLTEKCASIFPIAARCGLSCTPAPL